MSCGTGSVTWEVGTSSLVWTRGGRKMCPESHRGGAGSRGQEQGQVGTDLGIIPLVIFRLAGLEEVARVSVGES